jgi:anthranilate synthase component 2
MKILVLDNYDSFTYNLVYQLRELGFSDSLRVARNDKISLEEVAAFDKILLSPGPGLPADAGIMPALIRRYAPEKSILGICLGHQGIGEAFGSRLYNRETVLHGIASPIRVLAPQDPLFAGLGSSLQVGRYHSWAVDRDSLGEAFELIAEDEEGEPMGIRHTTHDVVGLQFHPESILTPQGKTIIANWLER